MSTGFRISNLFLAQRGGRRGDILFFPAELHPPDPHQGLLDQAPVEEDHIRQQADHEHLKADNEADGRKDQGLDVPGPVAGYGVEQNKGWNGLEGAGIPSLFFPVID